MNKLRILLAALGTVCFVSYSNAADVAMGKEKSEACAACHGANGISVSENFPNLAGQKEKYLNKQLHAFKAKTRENTLMNAIAEQLSDDDIGDLAAFFSSQPGGDGKAKSTLVAAINKSRVTFPQDYKSTYTKYTTISFAKKKQVRHYYANPIAVEAAKAGKPLPNGSKLFVEAFKQLPFLRPLLPPLPPRLQPERQQNRTYDHHAFHEDAEPGDLGIQSETGLGLAWRAG